MDSHLVLTAASSAISFVTGIITIYVGKAVAEAKLQILTDAQERELRLNGKIEELGRRLEDKLDGKVDKAAS